MKPIKYYNFIRLHQSFRMLFDKRHETSLVCFQKHKIRLLSDPEANLSSIGRHSILHRGVGMQSYCEQPAWELISINSYKKCKEVAFRVDSSFNLMKSFISVQIQQTRVRLSSQQQAKSQVGTSQAVHSMLLFDGIWKAEGSSHGHRFCPHKFQYSLLFHNVV